MLGGCTVYPNVIFGDSVKKKLIGYCASKPIALACYDYRACKFALLLVHVLMYANASL